MSSDPRHVGEGLARAREALESAVGPPSAAPVFDEADVEAVRHARVRGIDEMRQASWGSMCPQRFHNATLDWTVEHHGDELVGTIRDWQRLAPRPNLVLLGPVGTGKTGTAIAACRDDWMSRGIEVRFHPIVELLDMLRPGGHDDGFDYLVDAPRLIVDDVGSERATDWTAERFFAVINRRWLEERPTIVTSNLNADELRDTVGERVYSRLVGCDACVVGLTGADRRRA